MSEKNTEIITVSNLQSYFYDSLVDINSKFTNPLPHEAIYYSSDVLVKYSISEQYFTNDEGRIREKILGEMLLSATSKSLEEQKRIYKDIGDTSLFICGYFADSINAKLVDRSYYQSLGVTAYNRLSFNMMASYFQDIASLIAIVASKDKSDPLKHYSIK